MNSSAAPPISSEALDALRRAVARLAVAVAVADGRLAKQEIELVASMDRIGLGSVSAAAQDELRAAASGPIDVQDASDTVSAAGIHLAEMVFSALVQLAASDGQVTADEREVLGDISAALGIEGRPPEGGPGGARRTSDGSDPAASPPAAAASREIPPPPGFPADPLAGPLALLGLEPGATQADADRAYLALVVRYDPGRVIELGPEFVSLAVRKLHQATVAWEALVSARRRPLPG